MTRPAPILTAPEPLLAGWVALLYWTVSRHGSGSDTDLETLGRLVWILPIVAVPTAFLPGLLSGARSVPWLARCLVATFVAIGIGSGRTVSAFGPGPRGQDAAFILSVTLGLALASVATSISGAVLLCDAHPAAAAWFRRRPVIGTALILVATVPISVLAGAVLTAVLGIVAGVAVAFGR